METRNAPDATLKVYEGVCDNFAGQWDVRFKLLGLLPTGTTGVLAGIASSASTPPIAKTLLCVLGAIITIALWIYDKRTGQYITKLRDMGAALETALVGTGLQGQFSMPQPAMHPSWLSHGFAMNMIYGTCLLAWAVGSGCWLSKVLVCAC